MWKSLLLKFITLYSWPHALRTAPLLQVAGSGRPIRGARGGLLPLVLCGLFPLWGEEGSGGRSSRTNSLFLNERPNSVQSLWEVFFFWGGGRGLCLFSLLFSNFFTWTRLQPWTLCGHVVWARKVGRGKDLEFLKHQQFGTRMSNKGQGIFSKDLYVPLRLS